MEIATTRPETLLGDTAIAVHPDDERYKDIVGKMCKLPLTDREIPIVADYYVDKEFEQVRLRSHRHMTLTTLKSENVTTCRRSTS